MSSSTIAPVSPRKRGGNSNPQLSPRVSPRGRAGSVPKTVEQERKERLEKLFKQFDKNGDGHLSVSEVSDLLYSVGVSPSLQGVRDVIQKLDTNGNGEVEKEEFVDFVMKNYEQKPITKEAIEALFDRFNGTEDVKDDVITFKEFDEAFGRVGISIGRKERRSLFRELDQDGSRSLTKDEFCNIVSRFVEANGGAWQHLLAKVLVSSLWVPIPKVTPEELEAARKAGKKAVTFVRHGQSVANLHADRYNEDLLVSEPKLTKRGREQAAKAARQVAHLQPELIVVSPLHRAIQTASIIFKKQIKEGTPLVIHPLATEQVTGADDLGESPRVVKATWSSHPTVGKKIDWTHFPDTPEVWFWTPTPFKTRTEAWNDYARKSAELREEEPWHKCVERAEDLEDWLSRRPESVIAVVAHGDFLEAVTGHDFDNAEHYTLILNPVKPGSRLQRKKGETGFSGPA